MRIDGTRAQFVRERNRRNQKQNAGASKQSTATELADTDAVTNIATPGRVSLASQSHEQCVGCNGDGWEIQCGVTRRGLLRHVEVAFKTPEKHLHAVIFGRKLQGYVRRGKLMRRSAQGVVINTRHVKE